MSPQFLRSALPIFLFLTVFIHFYFNRTTINPHYGKTFYRLGLQCQSSCSSNKQLSYFQKAVFYDPNLTDAYYQLGIIYGKKGQDEKEFMLYKKVTTLDHTNAEAYFKIGYYYFEKGELDYALRYFLQSNSHKPGGSSDTFYYMARAYERKQMYKDAVRHYLILFTRDSLFSVEVCERIWRISKIPGQYEMVSDEVNKMRGNREQEKLNEQIDRYLRTDEVPEFMRKSEEQVGSINDQP